MYTPADPECVERYEDSTKQVGDGKGDDEETEPLKMWVGGCVNLIGPELTCFLSSLSPLMTRMSAVLETMMSTAKMFTRRFLQFQ